MKKSWRVKPVCLAIWMLGSAFEVSAAGVQVTKEVINTAIAQTDDKTLPALEVTADAPKEETQFAVKVATRPDLEPDSVLNPYRVEATARFGSEVLTQKDIEAIHPKDLYDFLDKAAGMDLTYQGRKSPYFLNERGGGSITFILDGALLPTQSNRIIQSIPLAAIEQIQVMRGSTSLALGPSISYGSSNSPSGLNTGFVIIRTKRPAKTEAKLTTALEKAKSQPVANKESLFAGTHLGAADDLNGYVGGLLARSDTPSKPTWFDGQSYSAGMFTSGLKYGKFSINFMGYESTAGLEMQRGVKYDGSLDTSKWYYDPLVTTVLSTDMSMEWSKNQTSLFSIFKTMYHQHEIDQSFTNSTRSDRIFNESTNGLSFRHNARFRDTLIQAGVQLENSQGFGPNTSSNYNNWDTSVLGWSISGEQKLFDNAVTLDVGYRWDQKHINRSASFSPATVVLTAAQKLGKNAAQQAALIAQLQPAYTASQIAAKLATGNNSDLAPAQIFTLGARWKINDMFALNGRYFDGDEGTNGDFNIVTLNGLPLHAEHQRRKEIAFEASPWTFFRPMLSVFDVDIKNQKTASSSTYVVDGQTYYYYTEGNSRRLGLELAFKGSITPKTSYSFVWTHMYENSITSAGVVTENNGFKNPMNLYTAVLSHEWGPYRANVSLKKVDQYTASTSSPGTFNGVFGDYVNINANIARDFVVDGHKLTGKIYGRNLLNEQFATKYTTGYYYDRGRVLGLEFSAEY
ncbi:MAG: TonB-dependent receptor plug domain-containing protein [Methylophilaceae bacterium]